MARNLFVAAGAGRVIALTIGKYANRYSTYDLKPGLTIDPFKISTLAVDDFDEVTHSLSENVSNPRLMADLFERAVKDSP